jgi:hypothetical protein
MLALRPELPREADDWVAQALAIDREERFGNVRAMWNAFLATFHLRPPKRSKGPSMWDAAKRTMGRLAHGGLGGDTPHPGDKPRSEPIAPVSVAPRFTSGPPDATTTPHPPTQRKLPSAPPRPRPRAPAPEPTVEISDSDFIDALPPRLAPPPPPPPPAPRKQRVVEKTVELSDADLELQVAIPERVQPEPAAKPHAPAAVQPVVEARPSEAEREKERNRERNKRKKQRKKQRKR